LKKENTQLAKRKLFSAYGYSEIWSRTIFINLQVSTVEFFHELINFCGRSCKKAGLKPFLVIFGYAKGIA
jgi:tagatose-1,6-bisphosphate aldolase non-catalytic subunit AgaZ/GatZ